MPYDKTCWILNLLKYKVFWDAIGNICLDICLYWTLAPRTPPYLKWSSSFSIWFFCSLAVRVLAVPTADSSLLAERSFGSLSLHFWYLWGVSRRYWQFACTTNSSLVGNPTIVQIAGLGRQKCGFLLALANTIICILSHCLEEGFVWGGLEGINCYPCALV